jgi:hypothetical protein
MSQTHKTLVKSQDRNPTIPTIALIFLLLAITYNS